MDKFNLKDFTKNGNLDNIGTRPYVFTKGEGCGLRFGVITFNDLKNDHSITILPADKVGVTVVKDTADYKAKALQQLSDTVTSSDTPC